MNIQEKKNGHIGSDQPALGITRECNQPTVCPSLG